MRNNAILGKLLHMTFIFALVSRPSTAESVKSIWVSLARTKAVCQPHSCTAYTPTRCETPNFSLFEVEDT